MPAISIHVLNRAVGRATLFDKPADYAAFEKVLREAWERTQMRLLHYVVMPNHWHLVAWPQSDGQLSNWAQWLTVTHVRRWSSLWHQVHATQAPWLSAGPLPDAPHPFQAQR